MAYGAPIFYGEVVQGINLVLLVLALIIEVIAFGHCLVQRADAFGAINTLPKGGWLALSGGAIVATLLLGTISMFGLVAIVIAGVYLLDVRPALRDAVDGHGNW